MLLNGWLSWVQEVGRALKAVDANLFKNWLDWAKGTYVGITPLPACLPACRPACLFCHCL